MQDWTADQTFDSRSEPLVFVRDMASVLALLDNCAVQLWESKSQTHKLPTNPIPSLADDPAMLVDAKDCSATRQYARQPVSLLYTPTILNLVGGQKNCLHSGSTVRWH